MTPFDAVDGEIDGQVKTTEGVCLNGGKSGQTAIRIQENRKIRPSVGYGETTISLCDGMPVQFSRLWMPSGEGRLKPFGEGYWAKLDAKVPYDWEDDNAIPASFEVQLGKMFNPNFGVFTEGLIGLGGDRPYDYGIGVGLRFNY